MIANAPRGSRRIGILGFATAVVVVTALTAAAPVNATTAADCIQADPGDNLVEVCLTAEQIATMDDAGATLAVDEISSSRNSHQIASIPKQAPFNTIPSIASDIAFQGNFAFQGNYDGFVIYDIHNPRKPSVLTQVLCPGSQNDVSVF